MGKRTFLEFFAGGGMARAGLGANWHCLLANDFDSMKAETYTANWGGDHLKVADVAELSINDLPLYADLAWASFPCQDLSLAGNGAGIGEGAGTSRSGSFWSFWTLIKQLRSHNRHPAIIVLENVFGSLTVNDGRDFSNICRCLSLAGYRFGALLVDAVDFVPQSRARVFVIAIRQDLDIPNDLVSTHPNPAWHPPAMTSALARLAEPDFNMSVWWKLSLPPKRKTSLVDIIEADPTGVDWHTNDETDRMIAMMTKRHRERLQQMKTCGKFTVGTIYKRMRKAQDGTKRQCAELRWDGIAGCLRTPGGGSSRQTLLLVDGENVRSRLLSPREAARLMGLPDTYKLPARYNDAYRVAGDGLVVPVVSFLARNLLDPLLVANELQCDVAAE